MGKFQLITPYPSDKIYEDSNVNKCAKKFYTMLKEKNEHHSYFTIKNIDDGAYYKFSIKKNVQGGGGKENPDNTSGDLTKRIEKLENRVIILEEIIRKATDATKEEIKKEDDEKKKEDNNDDNDNDNDKVDKKCNNSEGGDKKEHHGLIAPPKHEDMCVIC